MSDCKMSPKTRGRKPELPALTAVRFFAAMHVVFLHYGGNIFPLPAWLENIRSVGFIAVSFFFVLSGFILTYNYSEMSTAEDRWSFWQSRVARIAPLYFAALLISQPVGWLVEGESLGLKLGALLAQLAAVQSWVPALALYFNPPGWSIGTEGFFYLAFPYLVRWQVRPRPLRQRLRFMVFLWAMSTAIATCSYLLGRRPELTAEQLTLFGWFFTFCPILRLPEFALGMALGALWLQDGPRQRRRGGMLVAALGTLGLLAVLAVSNRVPVHFLNNVALTPFFAAIIYGLSQIEATSAKRGVLVRLGDDSYAIYALHWPVMGIYRWLDSSTRPRRSPQAFFLTYLVLLLVVCRLAYRCLERPAQRWIRQRWSPRATGRAAG